MTSLDWTPFKAFIIAKSLSVQYAEDDSFYYLVANEGPNHFECKISKTLPGDATALSDFETNYKPSGNTRIFPHLVSNRLPVDGSGVVQPVSQSGIWNITNISGTVSLPTGAATSANQSSELTLIGGVTETAPASDTASSGLNGRLQRIAQRLTSLIALIPYINSIAWFTRISDGTNNVSVTANGGLSTSDTLNASGVQGAISVNSSAIAVRVGGANLTNRKNLFFQNNGTATLYWGYTNAVTTSTGIPIFRNQYVTGDWGASTTIYIIGSSGTHDVRVVEGA